MGDCFVGGNSINKKRVPFSNCSKRSYRAMPVQPSAHLNPSFIRLVISTALSTMSLSRTVNVQQIGKSQFA